MFDRLKRKEQRAMQNKEAEEVYDKKARFVLFDHEGKQFNEESVLRESNAESPSTSTISGSKYYVLWYDSKMRNYELFVEYLARKRLAQAEIQPILVVDKEAHLDKVREIWQNSQGNEQVRDKFTVLLLRELTDQESLLRTFGVKEGDSKPAA